MLSCSCYPFSLNLHCTNGKPHTPARLAAKPKTCTLPYLPWVSQLLKFLQLQYCTLTALRLVSRHELNLLERCDQSGHFLLSRRVAVEGLVSIGPLRLL